MNSYISLSIASLLPAVAATILFLLDKHTRFGQINYWLKQAIFGVVFGGLAVLGTEWGIPMNGAVANCRDGAVLTAGLMFGAPAGILAGLIGGIERWIAVAWGVGSFTRVACSVSTAIAGLYAAALRKFMFENKKPGWLISLCVGVVMEVFHLTMVFVTNMATPEKAMSVVRVCTAPLIIANSGAVLVAAIALTLLSGEKLHKKKTGVRISQTIQKRMLITVLVAFVITSGFVLELQDKIAAAQVDSLLSIALDDVDADIDDTSNENLLSLTRKIAAEATNDNLKAVAAKYDVSEISLINKDGIIEHSSVNKYVGFDMNSGKQSAEFLVLLGDTQEYVQGYQHITSDPSILRKYAGVKTETGFLQVGYNFSRFQQDVTDIVVDLTKNRHVGETGYILILDEQYRVLSSPAGLDADMLHTVFADAGFEKRDTTYPITIDGEPCFARYRTSEGYYIVSVLPKDEAFQMRNIAVFVNTYMEIWRLRRCSPSSTCSSSRWSSTRSKPSTPRLPKSPAAI